MDLVALLSLFPVHLDFLPHPSDPIVKDQGRGATPGGMAASSTPVSSSSMMAGKLTATEVSARLEALTQENEKEKKVSGQTKAALLPVVWKFVFYDTESLRSCRSFQWQHT